MTTKTMTTTTATLRLPFNRRQITHEQDARTRSVILHGLFADRKFEVGAPGRPATDQQFEVVKIASWSLKHSYIIKL